MIVTILLTVWITCGIIYVTRESARPFYGDFIILDFILSPYLIASDIMYYWKECKESRDKYKSRK